MSDPSYTYNDSVLTCKHIADLAHLIENPHSGDFYPFPSKAHAMLFLLQNSPRPIVCNKTIRIILWIYFTPFIGRAKSEIHLALLPTT